MVVWDALMTAMHMVQKRELYNFGWCSCNRGALAENYSMLQVQVLWSDSVTLRAASCHGWHLETSTFATLSNIMWGISHKTGFTRTGQRVVSFTNPLASGSEAGNLSRQRAAVSKYLLNPLIFQSQENFKQTNRLWWFHILIMIIHKVAHGIHYKT